MAANALAESPLSPHRAFSPRHHLAAEPVAVGHMAEASEM